LTPITATSVSAPFIVCPYVGSQVIGSSSIPELAPTSSGLADFDLAKCLDDAFLHREDIMLYYSISADILTDLMRKFSP